MGFDWYAVVTRAFISNHVTVSVVGTGRLWRMTADGTGHVSVWDKA